MARYAVGDIHGSYGKLMKALSNAGFTKTDDLYALGDYCDRGEDPLHVLYFLMDLGERFKGVFGNHDIWAWQYLYSKVNGIPYMSRDVEHCWMSNGGGATVDMLSKLSVAECKELLKWYSSLSYMVSLEDYVLMHSLRLPYAGDGMLEEDPLSVNIERCLEGGFCEKDYDSWFWDRTVDRKAFCSLCRTDDEEKSSCRKAMDVQYPAGIGKPYIIGHTPYLDGPKYDRTIGLINLDCGSFFDNEIPKAKGRVCVLNLDTSVWYDSQGSSGVFEKPVYETF